MALRAKLADFTHRRVIMPLMTQIKKGSSPDELATSLAWGAALGVFPLMGSTTALCALVGHMKKLNHVAMQLINYLMFPLHLALIIPFLKMGDWAFGAQVEGYSIPAMIGQFGESPVGFLHQYGGAALRACAVWALLIPIPALIFRAAVRPWLRRLAAKIHSKRSNH